MISIGSRSSSRQCSCRTGTTCRLCAAGRIASDLCRCNSRSCADLISIGARSSSRQCSCRTGTTCRLCAAGRIASDLCRYNSRSCADRYPLEPGLHRASVLVEQVPLAAYVLLAVLHLTFAVIIAGLVLI